MKKLFALALITIACATALALAAAPPTESSDEATPPPEASVPIDPLAGAIETGSCTVTFDCGDGNILSCTSASGFCSSGTGWVKCDGQYTWCPNRCTANVDCENGNHLYCSSLVGDCHEYYDAVQCDGQYEFCGPDIPY